MNEGDSRWVAARMVEVMGAIECEYMRPSVVFRPSLTKIARRWRAHHGGMSKLGVYADGSSPDEAMRNFDRAWVKRMEIT